MTRVIVFVEGQSEEAFVTQVLYDYFMRSGIYLTPIIGKFGNKIKMLG